MASGSDTTVKGAVVEASQITANIGSNLTIESLQDTSSYDSRQQSISGSVTVGASTSGNVSFNKSKVDSDYASVREQSGIRAGDGGFEVNVGNDTTLTGGAITSTQAAIDNDRNRFTTGGELTTGDIENRASYEAKSVGINIGSGINAQGKLAPSGTGAGLGSDSGSAASVTIASISGSAGNKDARTGDKETGIARIFDADKVQREINAQTTITQTFGREASKAVASFAKSQIDDVKKQQQAEAEKPAPDQEKLKALKDELQKWDEGGAYRVALHMAVGGLSGGTQGALGVGVAAAAAPLLNDLQDSLAKNLEQAGANSNVAKAAAQLVTGMTAAGIGSVASAGSAAGAMTAFNADTNNRQLHPTEIQWIKQNAKRFAQQQTGKAEPSAAEIAGAEKQLAEQAFRQTQLGAEGGAQAWDSSASAFLKTAGTQQLPNGGFLFYATPDQKADATMYLDSAIQNADFYAKNGLRQPTLIDLQAAAQRDADIRANLGVATKTALAASATLSLVGLTPATLLWTLSHPLEASTAGVISAETAAAITSGVVTPSTLAPMLSASGMKTVTTMGEAVSGQAAKATAGGYINAAKVCQSGCAITGLSSSEQALVAQIRAGKDTSGQLTEQLLGSVAARTGSTVLSGGKYGGNNGFDLVLKNADGTVTVVMDGKQMLQSGAFSLSANGAGGNTQNSVAWVEAVLRRLDENSAAYKAVDAASKNNTLVTAVGGVHRTTGQLVVLPVTVPVPTK